MKRDVILSIKPQFVELILSGSKQWEFRRRIWKLKKDNQIRRVWIYSSSPKKRIVAYFLPVEIYIDYLDSMWKHCSLLGGISKNLFYSYFSGKELGIALRISVEILDKSIDPYAEIPNFHPPQNFSYIDCEILENVGKKQILS